MKTTQLTATGTVKAHGGPARVYFITISNNGGAGVDGTVELRENQSPAGDTGTVRWSARFDGSTDELVAHYTFPGGEEGDEGIEFDNGIRVVLTDVTNVIITVGWAG